MKDFLFPDHLICVNCGKEVVDGSVFCETCYDELSLFSAKSERRCSQCSKPLIGDIKAYQMYRYKCKSCQETFHYYDRHIACARYEKLSKSLIQGLKYKEKLQYVPAVGNLMAEAIKNDEIGMTFDMIVPVPIHWTRQCHRGYNQAMLLAEALGLYYNEAMVVNLLKRHKKTTKLKNLDKNSRIEMLKDAIIMNNRIEHFSEVLMDKRILLVDDIYTTGATLDACSKVLYENGADTINCITFALGI